MLKRENILKYTFKDEVEMMRKKCYKITFSKEVYIELQPSVVLGLI